MQTLISHNLEDTDSIAKDFIEKLSQQKEKATVLALSGELGSGKTAFVKGIARHCGVTEHVTSPTFVILKRYELRRAPFKTLFHIDAYRLESAHELEALDFKPLLLNPNNLICIEWPERVAPSLGEDILRLSFRFIDETTREIILPS